MNKNEKRGVSPVVATTLLIAIVIVVITIIFIWSKSFIGESVQKGGLPAEQACSRINLQTSCFDGILQINNIGNIPVYQIDVRTREGGRSDIERYEESIGIGESTEIHLGASCPANHEVIPIILGNTQTSKRIHPCYDNTF